MPEILLQTKLVKPALRSTLVPRGGYFTIVLQKIVAIRLREGTRKMVGSALHGQTKQPRNEVILTLNIALFDSLDLTFPYHVHRFVTVNRSPSRWI